MALLEYEGDQCPGCGGQMTDTTSPDSEGAWHVPAPTRCHKCTAIASAQAPYAEAKHPHALLWAAEHH